MRRMLLLTALCLLARSAAQDIILFGDSLSDNGGGYAQNAKFVLRTNDVSHKHIAYHQDPKFDEQESSML